MAGKYFAKPTVCIHGHKHDSKREAARCVELHQDQREGRIHGLTVHPKYILSVDGEPIKMGNGHKAKYTPDFGYVEDDRVIVEDIKGVIVRDFPLRAALFRVLNPNIELRVTK